jgi:5-methylcytosine-specific restriction endonuclease McrA
MSERYNKFNSDMRLALITLLGNKCIECGSKENLILHHRDKNELNNIVANFEVLCRSCHSKIHEEELTRGMARTIALKKQGKQKIHSLV